MRGEDASSAGLRAEPRGPSLCRAQEEEEEPRRGGRAAAGPWALGRGPGSQARTPSFFPTRARSSRHLFPAWPLRAVSVESGPVSSLGLCNRPRDVLWTTGPEPKRECHQSRLSAVAQVFGKCHGAGPLNPAAGVLSAGLGFSVKFMVQANID